MDRPNNDYHLLKIPFLRGDCNESYLLPVDLVSTDVRAIKARICALPRSKWLILQKFAKSAVFRTFLQKSQKSQRDRREIEDFTPKNFL